MHVIGSTFRGVLILEIIGDFCRLRVLIDAQRPLRRDLFISMNENEKIDRPSANESPNRK